MFFKKQNSLALKHSMDKVQGFIKIVPINNLPRKIQAQQPSFQHLNLLQLNQLYLKQHFLFFQNP